MFATTRTFLKTYIELSDYKSSTFKLHIGVLQGSVWSSRLFIIYLNDFLDIEPCHFKLADGSAILLQGSDTDDLVSNFCHSCQNSENDANIGEWVSMDQNLKQ